MGNNFFRAAVLALLLTICACSKDGVAGDRISRDKGKRSAAAAIAVEIAYLPSGTRIPLSAVAALRVAKVLRSGDLAAVPHAHQRAKRRMRRARVDGAPCPVAGPQ